MITAVQITSVSWRISGSPRQEGLALIQMHRAGDLQTHGRAGENVRRGISISSSKHASRLCYQKKSSLRIFWSRLNACSSHSVVIPIIWSSIDPSYLNIAEPRLTSIMTDVNGRKLSFTDRLANVLRPNKSRNKLRKSTSEPTTPLPDSSTGQRRLQYGAIYRPEGAENTDEQTGERRDDTDLLHGLAHHDSHESLDSLLKVRLAELEPWRPPGEADIAKLPATLWELIASYLSPSDTASLAFSSKTLATRLGPQPWLYLNEEGSKDEKNRFLMTMDEHLPSHLLCFACRIYHFRTRIGDERLKATMVFNPLFNCASVGKPGYIPPKIRITPGYTLPYTFVQLVLRYLKYSPNHGIPLVDLNKRWKDRDSEWSHQSRYYIYKGRLLMRVVSRTFAAPKLPASGLRHLLYSREDYTPYFSCCSHWRDGKLMDICKCALGHIPEHRQTVAQQLQKGPMIQMNLTRPQPIVSLCSFCRPMRRCTECPTEYLVELKLSEDKNDPLVKFKQSILVTRWSDLGSGSSPYTPEWAAINGEGEYDSFAEMGKRAISGIFEAQNGVTLPGQRMLSLNPDKSKLGEDDHGWY